MKVGIIVDNITQHKWENGQIANELKKREIEHEIINIYTAPLSTEKKDWGVDVVLARTASATHFRIEALKSLEISGVKVINSSECIQNGGDKYTSLVMMQSEGLLTPKTFMVSSFESAVKATSELGTPVVFKPVFGTYGKGIFRMISLEKELHMLDELQYPYIVQEYIPHRYGDIRVFVVEDEALGAIRRVAPKDEWRTNVSAGAKSKPVKLTSKLGRIAVKAAKVMGTKYAGVDVIRRGREYVILEVNTQPDFRGFYSALGINPTSKIVDLIIKNRK